MRLLDLTLSTPEENLALDEALLRAEAVDTLRFWESPQPMVVLGRASRHEEEADVAACRHEGVPIVRRVSGGAAIIAGPGCLMYAVTLDLDHHEEITDVDSAHRVVLGRVVGALATLGVETTIAGTSDLALPTSDGLRKFSGNSVRLVRRRLLYHGTLLYDFDLALVGHLLRTPPRQPEYRSARSHGAFVANLPAPRQAVLEAIATAWDATATDIPRGVLADAERLASEKYSLTSWNFGR